MLGFDALGRLALGQATSGDVVQATSLVVGPPFIGTIYTAGANLLVAPETWTPHAVTVSGTGTLTLAEDGATSYHYANQVFTALPAGSYCFSIEFKGVGSNPRGHSTWIGNTAAPGNYLGLEVKSDGTVLGVYPIGGFFNSGVTVDPVGDGFWNVKLYFSTTVSIDNIELYLIEPSATDIYTYLGLNNGSGFQFRNAAVRPATSTVALAQTHALLAADLIGTSPALDIGILGQQHVLIAVALAVASPTLGQPVFSQNNVLAASALVAIPSAFGTAVIHEINLLSAANLATGPPLEAATAVGQKHVFVAVAFAPGVPGIGTPVISQKHSLTAIALTSSPPVFSASAIQQTHILAASSFATTPPVLPALFLGGLVGDLVVGDYALDNGLAALASADKILACTGPPTDYANAIALAIGEDVATFSAPQVNVGGGRKIISLAVTNGTVTGSGTPQRWAAVNTTNAHLLAHGRCTGGVPITPSVAWTLDPITIIQAGVL
jgi:hypothetical protein